MSNFLHRHNTDNVHTRAVIVGLINLLNSRVFYSNVLADSTEENIGVPFLPNMGGDERFLQDFFLHWNECIHPRMADGNYDVIPRGVVTFSSNTINTTAMTHRFVRASYVKEVNGELQRFNSFLNSIPLTMDFDIEVQTDSLLDAFKIQQSILETFYKVQVFSVNFKGFRVPCQAGFSDDLGVEKTFEFTYQSNEEVKFKFSVSVETYYPVTDPTTTRKDSNRIMGFNQAPRAIQNENEETPLSLNPKSQGFLGKIYPIGERDRPLHYIEFTSPTEADTFFSSGLLPLQWKNTGTVVGVNLYYQIEGTEEWVLIAKNLTNRGFYDWAIPFFDQEGKEVEADDTSSRVVSSSGIKSRVRAIIGSSSGVERIVVFDQGVAYNNDDNIEVAVVPRPFQETPTVVPPLIQADVNGGGEVLGGKIIDPGSGFAPSVSTRILLKIEDAGNTNVFGILKKSTSFTGDIDNTTVPSEQLYITNISPTVNDLVDTGYLIVGLSVSGNGISEETLVEEIDAVNNKIVLNKPVTAKETGDQFDLSEVISILTII